MGGFGLDGLRPRLAAIASEVKKLFPEGIDRVLELIGTTTLLDSLQALKRRGIVCMTGILGGEWQLGEFRPMGQIPTAVKLTTYSGEATDITNEKLQNYVTLVEKGELKIKVGEIFNFEELQKAHQLMDENLSNGKIVVII